MTNDELIAKAREHAADFERGGALPARVGEFASTRVRETALVYFGSNDRDDHIQILLDRETGEFISAEYSPPPDTVTRPRLEFVLWAPSADYAGPEAVFRVSNPGDRAILVWNVRKQVAVTSSGETTWVTKESDYPCRGWSDDVIQPGQWAEFPMAPSWEAD